MYVLVSVEDRGLESLLREIKTDGLKIGIAGNGRTAARSSAHAPDVVFVNGGNPAAAARRMRSDPLLIVVSERKEDAARAFEIDAFDFLLKPVTEDRLKTSLERVKEALKERRRREQNAQWVRSELKKRVNRSERTRNGAYPDRLILKSRGRLTFVDADEIDWIEATDVYVRLHNGDKSHLVRERLKNVERKLDPKRFMRIHRSTIVNVERIREVTPHPYGGAVVVLQDGTRLKVSRTYRNRLTPTFG